MPAPAANVAWATPTVPSSGRTVFAAALAPALAASEAMRRIITAEELTVRPAVAVAAAAALADSVQHDPATGLLAARLAGRTVPALVLQQLGDGTATVQIEGEAMRVAGRLPAAGQSVLLRFPAPAAEPQSGPGFVPAPPATRAADVSVGALAHALSDAARAPATPLPLGPIDADPAHPREFARALAAVLRDSGMFYESHLARWSQGQYPLALLQREPQAVAGGSSELVRPARAEAEHAAGATARADVPTTPASGNTHATLPESLQPVIREQLQLLENRSLAVMVEPWPGQTARLEIAQEDRAGNDREASTGGAAEASWVTRLSLDLPSLGRVDAELALTGDRLSLVFHADPDSSPDLVCNTANLTQAMAGAGITLAGCKVVNHAAA